MNFVTLKDLLPLVPEIIILFTSFIVILVDLFAPKKNRMTTLAVTSLVGIGLAPTGRWSVTHIRFFSNHFI